MPGFREHVQSGTACRGVAGLSYGATSGAAHILMRGSASSVRVNEHRVLIRAVGTAIGFAERLAVIGRRR